MAGKDLDTLRRMHEVGGFLDEVFGLHSQQCAEKAIKASLCFLGISFGRIHDLKILMRLLENTAAIDAALIEPLLYLTDFAVIFRYEPYEDFDVPLDREDIIVRLTKLVALAAESSRQ